MTAAEAVARAFHEAYERLAPDHGYETREASRATWQDVPVANRRLMVAVAAELLERDVVRVGERIVGAVPSAAPTNLREA